MLFSSTGLVAITGVAIIVYIDQREPRRPTPRQLVLPGIETPPAYRQTDMACLGSARVRVVRMRRRRRCRWGRGVVGEGLKAVPLRPLVVEITTFPQVRGYFRPRRPNRPDRAPSKLLPVARSRHQPPSHLPARWVPVANGQDPTLRVAADAPAGCDDRASLSTSGPRKCRILLGAHGEPAPRIWRVRPGPNGIERCEQDGHHDVVVRPPSHDFIELNPSVARSPRIGLATTGTPIVTAETTAVDSMTTCTFAHRTPSVASSIWNLGQVRGNVCTLATRWPSR